MLSGNTFASGEFYCDVIANEHKWCLVFDCTELLRFSHVVHCLVSSFTCTFSFQKMLIENFHKLNRPQRHQNRTSTSTQKCSCYANYTFCFDPWAIWQQLSTTSLARIWTPFTSFIVKMKSISPLSGAKAISPVSMQPCAAMCTKATEQSRLNTSTFVASLPTRGAQPSSLPITSTSSLAYGKIGSFVTPWTHGSPTRCTPGLQW